MLFKFLSDISTSFVLGLLTPLTAVCVLPLYPGFIAYLSNQVTGKEDKKTLALFGGVITFGVISFMTILGLIFTTILQVSLTNVIGKVSPIAFGILAVISLILIFDFDVGKYLPKAQSPETKNPWLRAFIYGFFFGAIVVPCNPAFIAVLFTRTISTLGFLKNILSFSFFGVGMGAPLLVFSLISTAKSNEVIFFLTKHRRSINLGAGIMMLVISVYYLVFVFRVI